MGYKETEKSVRYSLKMSTEVGEKVNEKISEKVSERVESENKYSLNTVVTYTNLFGRVVPKVARKDPEPVQIEHSVIQEETEKDSPKKNKILLIVSVVGTVVLLTVLGIILGISLRKSKVKEISFPPKEKFVAKIKREINEVVRYNQIKNTTVVVEKGEGKEVNDMQVLTDFIVNIYSINEEVNYTKYLAYAVVLNQTQINKTDSQFIGGFDVYSASEIEEGEEDEDEESFEIPEFLEGEAITEEFKQKYLNYSNTLPMVKFSFFENGTIDELYFPEMIDNSMFAAIEDLISKVTPSISEHLYIKNSKRRLGEDGYITNEYESDNITTTLQEKEASGISTRDGYDVSGSHLNSSTTTKILEEEGRIDSISYQGSSLFQDDGTFPEDPEIDPDSPMNNDDIKDENVNLIKTDIKSISSTSTSQIDFIEKTIDPLLTEKLNNISLSLNYATLSNSSYQNNTLRILRELNLKESSFYDRDLTEIPLITTKKSLRLLKLESIERPVDFRYDIFKANLLGIKLQLTTVTTVDPRSGDSTSDIVLTLAGLSIRIAKITEKTSLSKGLSKAVQISESFVKFIKEIQKNVKSMVPNWLMNFVEKIEEISGLIQEGNVDIANLYAEPMNELAEKIQGFTSNIFDSIESAVTSSNEKLNELTKKVSKEEFPAVEKILISVKEMYYDFIFSMKALLETFHSEGLQFIKNINSSVENLSVFQIDTLYDIIDEFERAREIYETFCDKLFNAIEKGIDGFEGDLLGKVREVVGKGLDTVEFIVEALRGNVFVRLTVGKEKRREMISKLETFTERVNGVVDTIIAKIRGTFAAEISSNSASRIRSELVESLDSSLKDFNLKSNSVIQNIKSKIDCILLFEAFAENINVLEEIENSASDTIRDKFEKYFYLPFKNLDKEMINDTLVKKFKSNLQRKANDIKKVLKDEADEVNNAVKKKIKEIKDKYFDKLRRLVNSIVQSFNKESIDKLGGNYVELMIFAAETIKQRMESNYNLGYEYVESTYQLYAERGDANPRRTTSFILKNAKFIEYFASFQSFINNNFEDMMRTSFSEIQSSLREYINNSVQGLVPDAVLNFQDLSFISDYVGYITLIKDRIDEELSQEKFDEVFSAQFQNLLSGINSLSADIMDRFVFQSKRLDHVPVTDSSRDYCRVKKVFHHGKRVEKDECHTVSNRNNINKVIDSIPLDSFKNNTLEIITNKIEKVNFYMNEFKKILKSVSDDINSILMEKLDSFDKLVVKVNSFAEESSSIVDNFLGKKLLVNSHKFLSNNLGKKLLNYYDEIETEYSKLNTTFLENYLKINISSFVEKPKEINFKLSQILQNYIGRGDNIFDDIEDSLTSAMNFVLKNFYALHTELIGTSLNDILSDLPEFPFEDLLKKRTDYISQRLLQIKNKLNSDVSDLVNKQNQAKILNVTITDIFNISSLFSELNEGVKSKVNNTRDIVESMIDEFDKDFSFSKYNFQIVKLRGALKHINYARNNIKKIIQNNNFDVFELDDFTSKFNETMENKIYDFAKNVKDSLKEINKETQIVLLPVINSIDGTVSEIIKDQINKDTLENKITIFAVEVMKMSQEFKDLQVIRVQEFKDKVTGVFEKAVNQFFEKTKGKYKLNEEKIKESWQDLKKRIGHEMDAFINSTLDLTLDEDTIYDAVDVFTLNSDSVFESTKEKIQSLSSEYDLSTELLGLTLKIPDIAIEKVNDIQSDISNGILFNTSEIMLQKYYELKKGIKNYTNEIKEEILSISDEELDRYLEVLRKSSPDYNENMNNSTNENDSLRALEDLKDDLIDILNVDEEIQEEIFNESVKFIAILKETFNQDVNQMVKTFSSEKYGILDISTDLSQLDSSLTGVFQSVDKLIKERITTEEYEFSEKIFDIIKPSFEDIASDYMNKFGSIYIEKVKNKIISHGIAPSMTLIKSKVIEVGDFIKNVLNDTSGMTSSTHLLVQELFPKVKSLLEEEMEKQINDVVNKSFDKMISSSTEQLVEKFIQFFYTSETLNKLLKRSTMQFIKEEINSKFIKELSALLKEKATKTLFGDFKKAIESSLNEEANKIKDAATKKKEEMDLALSNKKIEQIEAVFEPIIKLLSEFKGKVDNQVSTFVFTVSEEPIGYFTELLTEEIKPIIDAVASKYDLLQDDLLKKIYEVVDGFEDIVQKLIDMLPTEKIVEQGKEIRDKINLYLSSIKETVITLIEEIDFKVKSTISGLWRLRRNKQSSKELRDTSVKSFEDIKKTFEGVMNVINDFKVTIATMKKSDHMISNFNLFKSSFQTGIKHIRYPVNNTLRKLRTLLTEEKLKEFEDRIEGEISQVTQIANTHYTEVSEVVLDTIDRITVYPKELSQEIEEEGIKLLDSKIDWLLKKALSSVVESKKKLWPRDKREQYPFCFFVMGIPFTFLIDLKYGYEIGLLYGAEQLNIYVELYGKAYAEVTAEVGLGVGINVFGAGLIGVIGDGKIGIRPKFNVKTFGVQLDTYIQINAFQIDAYVLYTLPAIYLIKIKVKVFGIKFYIVIPIIYPKPVKLGAQAFKGVYYEKHFLKNY